MGEGEGSLKITNYGTYISLFLAHQMEFYYIMYACVCKHDSQQILACKYHICYDI